ncbi:MAG: YciI family protein [Polymorphobacter sp.]|uniref:YciI family protein n=1 Tax=Polymorphobacter sp. TaxID=1909290 RepID=UPI003A86E03C
MQFTLLYHEQPSEMQRRGAADADAYWGAWTAYMGAMSAAGVMVGGNGLLPPDTATTLRIENGKWQVHDGPFADTKEQLGGYVVINVADLDAALEWAARAPCAAAGSVEIRPVMPSPPGN